MISRGVVVLDDHFDRNQVFTTTAGYNGWTLAKTASGGSPTAQTATGPCGSAVLTLAATSEAEVLCLSQGDVLTLGLGNNSIQRIDMIASIAGVDSVTTMVIGVGTARNDTIASVTTAAWFKILGSTSTSNVVIDCRDGTNAALNIATGVTLGSTAKKFTIDFEKGLADVRFFIDGERVATGTTFSMAAATSTQCVQPILQLQKASGTGVPALTIQRVLTQQHFAYGA